MKKVANGVTTIFHYNLAGQVIAESTAAGTVATEYVYLNSNPLAKIEGNKIYYYHNDHLGTPQKMTDGSGLVVWVADYKPFGEATITVSTITNNLRFPGQYYDAETGLNYNYYRDYNPAIGRYIESDPIGIRRGMNHLYSYVGNNPINRRDPLGLDDLDFSDYGVDTSNLKLDGPNGFIYHGKWCGPGWTGGQSGPYNPGNPNYAEPTDDLDTACLMHDRCYYDCRRKYPCDKEMRRACMESCDWALARDAEMTGNKYGGLWLAMKVWPVSPGPDDCKCKK